MCISPLKQSGRPWNKNVIELSTKVLGFTQLNRDVSILIRRSADGEISMVGIYVDDFLIASNQTPNRVPLFHQICASQRIQYQRARRNKDSNWMADHSRRRKGNVEDRPVSDLLEEDLTNCKAVNIPMKEGSVLDMSEHDDDEEAELRPYQRLIGKLMYLSCGTRPDIAFVVGQLSMHNADPRLGHMRAAKRVVRYLGGTTHIGLTYDRNTIGQKSEDSDAPGPFRLIGYADSDFAGDPEDRKSVIGYFFFMAGALVSWSSNKQRTVSTSTTEAEYIALGHVSREGVWIRHFLNEMARARPMKLC